MFICFTSYCIMMFNLEPLKEMINRELINALTFHKKEKLHEAMAYLPLAGGKRLRPIITMLSAEAVGGEKTKVLPICTALELIHNFTLVHDDIMDKDIVRRNIPTTHIKYGEETALIAGDALFARAFEVLSLLDVDFDKYRKIIKEVSCAVREIAEGQYLDMVFETNQDVSVEDYLKMVEKKTARIIQTGAKCGAIASNGSKEEIEALSDYGKYVGIGFQIQDDIIGVIGNSKQTGKSVGNDVRRGKKTLIIIHCLENANKKDRDYIVSNLGNKNITDEIINEIVTILKKIDSINYAKNTANKYIDDAKNKLDILRSSEAKNSLLFIADYCIVRER